jgi:uncharacterized membrane protein HdeD (DUF308 family)
MTTNSSSASDPISAPAAKSIHDHWILFVAEGVALIALGLVAIIVPSIAASYLTVALGWVFLGSGAIGLATTFWARQAPSPSAAGRVT